MGEWERLSLLSADLWERLPLEDQPVSAPGHQPSPQLHGLTGHAGAPSPGFALSSAVAAYGRGLGSSGACGAGLVVLFFL